jgi:Uri superfamily endonuclease
VSRDERRRRRVPREAGTYVILLRLPEATKKIVGRLGEVRFDSGFYAYVGSALGPGGLQARVGHHLTITDRPRWHVDYLRRIASPIEIWYVLSTEVLEHGWARELSTMAGWNVGPRRFGSSDCSCGSHLLHARRRPVHREFRRSVTDGKASARLRYKVGGP